MNVKFRPLMPKDVPLLKRWQNLERVRKNSHNHKKQSLADQLKWFKKVMASKSYDMFMVLNNNKPVGVCGLTRINYKHRSASITHYLGRQLCPAADVAIGIEAYDFLKKRAFEGYNLKKLKGEAFSFNQGGIKLALFCGFKKERIKKESIFWKGRYWDSIIVGMLAQKYFKSKDKNEKN